MMGVALFFVITALIFKIRAKPGYETFIILCYCAVVVFQQFFIDAGRLWFGAQYAIVLLALIVPSVILKSLDWRSLSYRADWDMCIKFLSALLIINIVGSRIFGFGEVYETSDGGRYFGFLGDSISPVIIFPMLYFYFQRQYNLAILMLLTLILTGGRAAIVMLLMCPALFIIMRIHPILRFSMIISFIIISFYAESILNLLFGDLISDGRISYSFNTRLISIQAGWDYFLSSPIWGVGINQSMNSIYWDSVRFANALGTANFHAVYQVHNAFVRALAETGLVGFICLIFLCFCMLSVAMKGVNLAISKDFTTERSVSLASSLWVIGFIVSYQTTGWFEHGHPQLAWLLTLSALASVSTALLQNKSMGRHKNI